MKSRVRYTSPVGLAVFAALSFAAPASLDAQGARDQLIRQAMEAYENFETENALGLLKVAVNPAVGATDSVWAAGIQLFAQILIEEGRDSLANIWMRWAVRTEPRMRVDTVTYLPEVAAAYYAAQRLTAARSPGDAVTRTRWEWQVRGVAEEMGMMRVQAARMAAPIQVRIADVGAVSAGSPLTLRPGSYVVRVSATGHVEAEVTREVLPGVETVVEVTLTPVAVAAAPDSVLPDEAETAALRQAGRLSVARFGMGPACGAGVFVGRDGLFVTTYRAIRGAEELEVLLSDGRRVSEGISVAAYDVQRDVAVLRLPAAIGDSLQAAPGPEVNQYVWAIGYPGCGEVAVRRSRVTSWDNRPTGLLRLADSLAFGEQGGPLVSQRGLVVGLTLGGNAALPMDHGGASLEEARRNIRSRQLLTLAEVARRENHLFGAVAISSDLTGSVVRIRPLETWHWPELARDAALPLTFAGPMGRYRLELLLSGQVRRTAEYTLNPTIMDQLRLAAEAVAQEAAAPQATRTRGGKFPWPIAVLGVAGAGAAVALLAGGGGGGTQDCPSGYHWDAASGTCVRDTPAATTGGIIITIPNP